MQPLRDITNTNQDLNADSQAKKKITSSGKRQLVHGFIGYTKQTAYSEQQIKRSKPIVLKLFDLNPMLF